jgi:hypothetical protein
MTHTELSAAFYLLHTAVGSGAMNKLGICYQQRNGHFKPKNMLFSAGNSAMNAPRYWQRRNERSMMLATPQ